MLTASLRKLVRRLSPSTRRPARCRPGLEALEDRLLLSTRVWDGSADGSGVPFANSNWSAPQNWVGDIATVAGDDLRFPVSARQLTATNDFPAGTPFNSLAIAGTGYNLTGLREARRPIEKLGYWRRKEELEDTEAALLRKQPE